MNRADEILQTVQSAIVEWHEEKEKTEDPFLIKPDKNRKRKELWNHREDLLDAVSDLTKINTEIWHDEDMVRTNVDEAVIRAVRNMSPLNVVRNDLVEEIDEIVIDASGSRES